MSKTASTPAFSQAKWIWSQTSDVYGYNQTVIARRTFYMEPSGRAVMRITADSAYRLIINGRWVNDGPCRSWPEHYQYDEIDVTTYLRSGENTIRIIARYWGTGTFHTVPKQAGILAELATDNGGAESLILSTDGNWEAAQAPAWRANTPKISIQMEPQEDYDARLEEALDFTPARVLFDADDGPWHDLTPRDVELLTREPTAFVAFHDANLVRPIDGLNFCLPATRLEHPMLIEANHNVTQMSGMGTRLTLEETGPVTFHTEGFDLYVDGDLRDERTLTLREGAHLVLAFVNPPTGHQKERTLRIVEPPQGLRLHNPIDETSDNPWCWIPFAEYSHADNDMRRASYGYNEALQMKLDLYEGKIRTLGTGIASIEDFREQLSDQARVLDRAAMFVEDTHWHFTGRRVLGGARDRIAHPSGLIYDNDAYTVVQPDPEGDLELVYDLGEQVIGYYDLELIAEAEVEIECYGVEYIAPDGRIQHTRGNRNGMRYITREGRNRFTSTKRRSGRYLFITLRNQNAPVRIRKFQVVASTYPVDRSGSFRCSDADLNAIWAISARTLKLCMEDTFTDCPLYEQTLWVGDARNEAAFGYPVFNAMDIGRRCIRLAGQSVERYPIVGCQVPSAWDVLLPAWSFLWGISVWDYYAYSGDRAFLEEAWPWVIRNLEGAEAHLDPEWGLFSGPYWNMFDWSGIDDEHEIVLHNSMLLVGAINAALSCASIVGTPDQETWLTQFRRKLCTAINKLWDDEAQAYPDSIHADGGLSPSTSQHTSFLALLYDIIEPAHADAALENVRHPPEDMVRVGSPFAIMYYYEALEKAGKPDAILDSIYEAYVPMLEAGATTVWEVFPSSSVHPEGFPTRSHCHAWSSAPVLFLNRIILGIYPTAPGSRAFEISPRMYDLDWARGSVATPHGPLAVSWRRTGNTLQIEIQAPQGVDVEVVPNETLEALELDVTIDYQETA